MADDVAELGFKVDSKPIDEAAASLDNLAAVAKRTGEPLEVVRKRFEDLATARKTDTTAGLGQLNATEQARLASIKAATAADTHTKATAATAQAAATAGREMAGLQRALSVLAGQFEQNIQGMGRLGQLLQSFGPIGVAVGATIGTLVIGFEALNRAAEGLGERATQLRGFALSTGLSTEAIQALSHGAEQLGSTSGALQTMLQRFTVNLEEIRKGSGNAFIAIQTVNKELADQIAASRDTATGLELFAKAVDQAGAGANQLVNLVGGRGSVGLVPLFKELAHAGDLSNYVAHANDAITRTQAENDELSKLNNELKALKAQNIDLFAKMFSDDVLQGQIAYETRLNTIIKSLSTARTSVDSWIASHTTLASVLSVFGFTPGANPNLNQNVPAPPATNVGAGTPFAKTTDIETLQKIANAQKAVNAAMGAGVTFAQQLAAKEADLDVALKQGTITEEQYAKALGAEQLAISLQQLSQRNSLLGNLATVAELVKQKQLEVNEAVAKGVPINEKQIAQITEIARLQAIATKSGARVSALGDAATDAERYASELDALKVKLADTTITQDDFNKKVLLLNPAVSQVRTAIADLGSAMAQAFIHGQNAADALHNSLQAVASTAASSAINKVLTGDFAGAAISASISAISFLGSKIFGGSSAEDQQKAQQAAAAAEAARVAREQQIADAQIRAADYTLRAAQAMAKADFANRVVQFDIESQKQFDEESKRAGDLAIWQLVAARAAERVALIADGIQQATDTLTGANLSEVQTRLKAIADASEQLTQALQAQGSATDDVMGMTVKSISDLADTSLAATKPLSDVQKSVADLVGNANDLANALVQAGMSATDAAAAIDDKLNKALDVLRANFIADLVSKVNDLNGATFINQGQDLINQVNQLRADAASLGISTSLIDEFYLRSAQKIIDQNQLVGDQFTVLVKQLNLGDAGLHAFNAVLDQTAKVVTRSSEDIASAIQGYQDQLFTLQQNQDTLTGQLAVFDLQAQRAREAELAKGGQALVALEALQMAQRQKVIDDFNKQQAEAAQKALDDQKQFSEFPGLSRYRPAQAGESDAI